MAAGEGKVQHSLLTHSFCAINCAHMYAQVRMCMHTQARAHTHHTSLYVIGPDLCLKEMAQLLLEVWH